MALMLSGPNNEVLSVRIWHEWERGNLSEASALGVVMVLSMGTLICLIQRMWRMPAEGGVRQPVS
jgi:ABC-type Fe3+ transport system permease subunit